MNENLVIGIVSSLAALLLVGRSLVMRRRAGEPLVRYAIIWAVLFGGTFLVTTLVVR